MTHIYTNKGSVQIPERSHRDAPIYGAALIAERRHLKFLGGDATALLAPTGPNKSAQAISGQDVEQKPLPPIPRQKPPALNTGLARKSSPKSSPSSPIANALKSVRRVATFGFSSKHGGNKRDPPVSPASPVSPVYVDRGMQTDLTPKRVLPLEETGQKISKAPSNLERSPAKKSKPRPPRLTSFGSFLKTTPSESSFSREDDNQSSVTSTPSLSQRETRSDTSTLKPPSLTLVGPNCAQDMPNANKSLNTIGTYESRYSVSEESRPTSFRRAVSDSRLNLTPRGSVANLYPEMQSESAPDIRKPGRHSSSSDESLRYKIGHRNFVPGYSLAVKNKRSTTSSSLNSTPSPLRKEVKANGNSSPSPPKEPLRSPVFFHRQINDYFEYPGQLGESKDDVPEHLRGSLLCPLYPKCLGGPKTYCPFHGRISVPSTDSEGSSGGERMFRRLSDESSRRLGQGQALEIAEPDDDADSPECPANGEDWGTRADCVWYGRKGVVRGEDSEDSIPRPGVAW